MKKIILLTILLIFTIYALPMAADSLENSDYLTTKEYVVSNVKDLSISQDNYEQIAKDEKKASISSKKEHDSPSNNYSDKCMIKVSIDGVTQEMHLEDYVAGVTAAEIPASFPSEALKAQAIAARTFAKSKIQTDGDEVHPDADVCDDYTHCAAYLDLETQAYDQWGDDKEKYSEKIEQAVQETSGKIITYEGEPITAVFHASCGESTESALDVWGADVPYLVSVSSTGDDKCPDYISSVTFGSEEFRQTMLKKYSKINLTGLPATWFTDFERADSGNVIKCTVGGVKAKGTTLRALLGLRSTNFEVSTTESSITFDTTGYGHAVGMSQYGAKAMAENGSTCEEILTHYYTDTKIEDME